jgi:hypothetical protein
MTPSTSSLDRSGPVRGANTHLRRLSGALLAVLIGACTGSIGDASRGDVPGSGGGMPGVGDGSSTVLAATRTPLRRLTRVQYNNSLHDLLGVSGDFAQGFDPDEVPAGFASNLTATASAAQLDQYQQAAEQAAARAIAGGGLARLVPCAPPNGTAAACVDQFVSTFGRRAFRRPLATDEVDRYKAVYAAGSGGGATPNFAAGIQWVITAMLQSPYFLYLPELGDSTAAGPSAVPLTPYEVATRLSYFLIGSVPDDPLSTAADAHRLSTTDDIATQARRLLGTAPARDAMVNFHREWFELSDIMSTGKDPNVYPEFTPAVQQAMSDEFAAFVRGTMSDGDGKLETLLTADFSFIGAPLYPIYGLQIPAAGAPATPARVTLPAGQRAGLMTLPSILSVYGHTDQSAPVARGFLVSSKLLCDTPPPPPPGVNTNVPPPDPKVTTRQRLASHRTNPNCSTCHSLMDPYGLTFEIYDGIGRYRTNDGMQAVDATGTLPGIGPVHDAVELMKQLATSDQVRSCVVKQWFRYAFGRPETADDSETLATATDGFSRAGYQIPDLLVTLASSTGFRVRKQVVADTTPLTTSAGVSDGGAGVSTGTATDSGTVSIGDGAVPTDAAGSTPEAGGRNPNPNPNPCPASVTGYRLTGLSVSDFCDAYEKYCQYDPLGTMPASCGKPAGPVFKDRTDCMAQYTAAAPIGKSCRAGQLCQNAPRGLIVNACAHATGHCDPACGM